MFRSINSWMMFLMCTYCDMTQVGDTFIKCVTVRVDTMVEI